MSRLTIEDLFAIVWFGICTIFFLRSLSTYGILVWFKPEEFMKLYEEKKRKSPHWAKFFMKPNVTLLDLWFLRIVYLVAYIIIMIGLPLLILSFL